MNKSILLMPILLAGLAKSQEGRIGINTVSPKTTLDVNGKTDTNGLSLSSDITGLQAPRLTRAELTNKGNALYNADQRGAIVYITDVSGGNNVSQRVNITSVGYYYFDGTVWNRIASDSGAMVNQITSDNGLTKTGDNIQLGGALIKNTDIATAGFNTTFSGTGNVGIGTTLPTKKLEVVGDGKFVSSNNLVEVILSTPSPGLGLIKNGTANLTNPTVMGFMNFGGRINNTDNQSMSTIVSEYKGNGTNNFSNLAFRTSGVVDTDMVLNESGDLGVGANILPTQKLDVDGNVRFRQVPENASIDTNDRVMVLDNTGVAKKVPLSSVQSTVTSDNGLTKTGNNIQLGGTLIKNTDIATAGFNTTFSGTGKVGIGTNIPSNLLTINKNGITSGITTSFVDGITITSNMDSPGFSGPGLYFEGANGSAGQKVLKVNYSKNISDQSFLNFQAVSDNASIDSGSVMSMFHNGKIGVGNTDPTQQLDVNGNVRFRNVPSSNSVASDEFIMVLQANGTAKKVPLTSLQQSLSKIYFVNYGFDDPLGDFVENFDTKIPVSDYEVAVVGFGTTHRTSPNGAFINNNATAGLFQSPDIFAFRENGTWRLRADMPNATTTFVQPNFSWVIRLVVVSRNQANFINQQTFNLGGLSTGAATSSPVP